MKVGDKVYIICNNKWRWEGGKTCTVSKAGRIFFEVEEISSEYKFCVDPNNNDYSNLSLFAKGKRKGEQCNDFYWFPSEEYYLKMKENQSRCYFVRQNLSLLTDEEIFEIYHKIKGRKGE